MRTSVARMQCSRLVAYAKTPSRSAGRPIVSGLSYYPLCQQQHRPRHIHHGTGTSPTRQSLSAPPIASTSSYTKVNPQAALSPPSHPQPGASPSLSVLPLAAVLRSLFVTTVSCSPALLTPALGVLSVLANSKSIMLNPNRNLALRCILDSTLYTQFCAGEVAPQVTRCVQDLKGLGFAGVILGYAPETVLRDSEITAGLNDHEAKAEQEAAEIDYWRAGTLDTVDLAGDGGFVSLKFTGAGKQALRHLLHRQPPSPELEQATVDICERARERNVRLLFDAEQQAVQPGIDDWTFEFQRRYNNGPDRRAFVYGTYQSYLKSTPETLAQHMSIAQKEGFVLGVKLVRGAYLGTEPRDLIWSTKEETDQVYDGLAESLIKGEYGELLKPDPEHSGSSSSSSSFPEIGLMLASHNNDSVQRARKWHTEQLNSGRRQIEMSYGQLYGMADDLSCDLVHGSRHEDPVTGSSGADVPKVYKAVIWGTVGDCMKYLLRRAEENKDAASRTQDTRNAMAKELKRRLLAA